MRYRERVQVPPAWWVLAGLFAASLLLAVGYYLGAVWGIGVTLLALLVAAGIFSTAGLVLEVTPDELRVGRAVIDRRYLGEVRPLDAAATRRRAGVEADARAHLVLRPWVPTAVELTLADPADPVPYWLVSTRRPAALARALQPADDAARPPA